ncbi:MAG TPA: dickkopf-related protein [Polyangia bacterium]|nr:dickkopf-related protein [Polyangia bacterium]
MKSLSCMGAELRRVAVATVTLVALATTLLSCSSPSGKPPSTDGGAGHGGSTDAKPKTDGGDASVDACMASGSPHALGAACGCNAQCASGFCVENVCCDSACTGGCNTCSATGTPGMCVKRPAGDAPRNATDCAAQSAASCGFDGTCDGSGACRYLLGTTCVGGTCNSDAVVGAYACDGTGQCKPGVTMLCLPFTCDAMQGDPLMGQCYPKCTSNAQCTAGQQCNFATGSCGQGGPGAHCQTSADCISGFCADNVCCNVACGGACVACNLPGRLGTCWPVDSGKPDPRGVCTDKGATSCGHNGTCDGVGGCANYVQDVQCLAPSCTGNRLNTAGTCDGLGTCRPAGVQDCHPFRCVDGACTNSCQTDQDCDTGTACVNNTCGPKPLGFTCAAASECGSGQCVDGVCCESACTGACRSCNLPTSPGHCMTVAAGNVDPRKVCTDKGAASCGTNGQCDGTGSCAVYASGTVCASETCATGIYTPASTCNMTGQCVAPDSRACAPYICNGTQCFNACATSDQCKTPNSCILNSCGLKTNGASCSSAADCGSGFCAQGICCNAACGGACQSCALSNALGTCTSVPVNAVDPAGICKDKGATSCGTDGKCDGNGACQKYLQGTTCIGSSCPAGTTVFTAASTCDGAGTCVTPAPGPCFPFQCGVNVCKNSCATDADCASPAICNSGSCGLKSNGRTCGTAAECSSGFCSQQTCCATACQGACQSCGLTNSLGTCTNVANGLADPQGTCQDAGNASCSTDGFCNGNGACRLYAAGTSCAAPICPAAGSTLTSGRTCDGKGGCQAATSSSCVPYLCNGTTACKSACSADTDCLSPDICDPLTNVCGTKKRLGQACTASGDCLTGDSCVDGVCCSSSSCSTCQACNVSGSPGTCAPVAANAVEPHGLCAANPPCGNTGACNGAGACQLAGTGVSCGSQSCSGSTFTPVSHCSGSGTCAAPTSSTCSGGFVCDATNNVCKTTCTADGDCVAPLTCQGSGTSKSCARKPNGQACTGGTQCLTGFCTDGVCCGTGPCGTCQACNVNGIGSCSFITTGTTAPAGQCPVTTTCGNTGACNGAGACQQASTAVSCNTPICSGSTFTAQPFCSGSGTCATPTAGNCGAYICASTTACKTTCAADTDCVSGDYCTATSGGSCVAQKALGATCGTSHECAGGNSCVDGVCCSTTACGTCQACNVNGSGTCASVTSGVTDPHARCGATGTCGNTGTCNGAGACTQASTSVSCAAASCNSTTNIFTPAAFCSGAGACSTATTKSCAPYVCGAAACTTTCSTDTGATGCASGNYCTGVGGSCVALKASGAACGSAHECGSGNCVDGVCCGSGSCPSCQACNVTGSVGSCANVSSGITDPHARCAVTTTCGNTGTCNGAGACTQASSSVMCSGPGCSGTTFTAAAFCSGSGSCPSPTTSTCGQYICASTTACKTTCTADTDCISGDYCTSTSGGSCAAQKGLGAVCGTGHECGSGNCIDGVCCSTNGCGNCQACNITGTGTCAPIAAGSPAPSGQCAANGTCGNSGLCDGAGKCAQASSSTSCAGATCSGSLFVHTAACSGSGTCAAASTTDCFPYLCTTASPGCPNHCNTDGDCVATAYCTGLGGTCATRNGAGTACAANDQCQSPLFCTNGFCCGSSLCPSCQSCGVPGLQGACTNVPPGGADPTGTCTAQPATGCGTNGLCNGTGGCQSYGTSTVCAAASCAGDSSAFTTASLCDGAGNCTPGTTSSCPTQTCSTVGPVCQ